MRIKLNKNRIYLLRWLKNVYEKEYNLMKKDEANLFLEKMMWGLEMKRINSNY